MTARAFAGPAPSQQVWVNVRSFGAKADGISDDTAAIQAALNAAGPGRVVIMPPGCRTGAPIVVPPGVTLRGMHGTRYNPTDGVVIPPEIKLLPAFAGDAAIRLLDREEGGYTGESIGQRVENLSLDGSALVSPGAVAGIKATGNIRAVWIDNVSIKYMPNVGVLLANYTRVNTSVWHPYSWDIRNTIADNCGGIGFSLGQATDTTLINCEALGCQSHGFSLSGMANSSIVSCRSEWSNGHGYYITGGFGTAQGAGGMHLVGCTTDRNNLHGILVESTGSPQIVIAGCTLRRDGRNGGAGGGGYAGLAVAGASTPVVVSGLAVYPGVNDDGAGVNSPQYGVHVNGSNALTVDSGYLHAATKVWNDGGGNVIVQRGLGVIGATGTTAAPTRETVTHLDVLGRALGLVVPRDHGLIAWASDPAQVSSGKATVNGTLYLTAVPVHRAVTATKLVWGINTAGVTPTAGQNWVILVDPAGNIVASVDVTARVTATGAFPEPINVALTPGLYRVGFLFNATTPPQVYRNNDLAAALANAGITAAAQYRYATNGTGLTAVPASPIILGNNVSSQSTYWAALG